MNLRGVMMRSWWQTAVINHVMLLFWKQSFQSSGFLCPGHAFGPNAAKVLRLKASAKLCLKKIDQALVFWFSI
jgi:hypothetical protein